MKSFTQLDGLVVSVDRANVDTDAIIPKQFLKSIKRTGFGDFLFDEWRYHDHGEPGMDCTHRPRRTEFSLNQERYRGATILLARENFGCGSSREHAPIAIKGSQAKCIIAPSFARIFFRNCINIGLPILECPEAVADITEGDDVDVDLAAGQIFNRTNGHRYQAQALPDFVLKIADAGGIANFLRTHDIQELMS